MRELVLKHRNAVLAGLAIAGVALLVVIGTEIFSILREGGFSTAQSTAQADKLAALQRLRDSGVITAQEYQSKVQALQASAPAAGAVATAAGTSAPAAGAVTTALGTSGPAAGAAGAVTTAGTSAPAAGAAGAGDHGGWGLRSGGWRGGDGGRDLRTGGWRGGDGGRDLRSGGWRGDHGGRDRAGRGQDAGQDRVVRHAAGRGQRSGISDDRVHDGDPRRLEICRRYRPRPRVPLERRCAQVHRRRARMV